jgi:hypothetical protein
MTERPAERLLAAVWGGGGSTSARLSVVGICKNAGKTVTLNHLIQAAALQGISLGLVSTGRDGEEQDAITELPKPRIHVLAGAWIATARTALGTGTAVVTPVAELPMGTPFGPIVIGRVEAAGEVLLIGPGSAKRIGAVLDALEDKGARLLLVDGSFDRMAAAAPAVTGRVVLAAGAAYSHSMAETVAQVRHLLDIFDLPPAPSAVMAAAETQAHPVVLVLPDGGVEPVPVRSGLADPAPVVAALAARPGTYLVLAGALTDRLLLALVQSRTPCAGVVVADPTHILVDRNLWRRWRRQGGQAYVRQPVRLLAVTTNPYSPVGQGYDAQQFLAAIANLARRPVLDLVAGLSTETGGA